MRPTGDRERIDTLDVLRGLAILGILFVNIGMFSFPVGYSEIHRELFGGAADRIVHWATVFLIEGKFYSLFSVLFGIGVAIQFERVRRRGLRFGPWYARRLLVLLAIGLVHDIFLAPGIILITYSIVGFWIVPFLKRRSKTLLIWIGILPLIPLLVMSIVLVLRTATEHDAEDTAVPQATITPQEGAERGQAFEAEVERYAGGSYPDLVRVRLGEVPESLAVTLTLGSFVLAMFLIGLLVWRWGWISDPAAHRDEFRKLLAWGLVVGTVCTGAYVAVRATYTSSPPAVVFVPALLSQLVGNMSLCLGYLAAVVLAMTTPTGRRLLAPFAPVGRTALSNYIFQSAVGTSLFFGHGLGLYGTVGPASCALLVLVIFAVELALSAWWLHHFRFGPVEWIWRCLTYGRVFPIVRCSPSP